MSCTNFTVSAKLHEVLHAKLCYLYIVMCKNRYIVMDFQNSKTILSDTPTLLYLCQHVLK